MTLERAIQILTKMAITMNYNNRVNKEYASGLNKAYTRALRLLSPVPEIYGAGINKTLTDDTLTQILFIINDFKRIHNKYIADYLCKILVTDKDKLNESDTRQLLYYLGCIKGADASCSIIQQIGMVVGG